MASRTSIGIADQFKRKERRFPLYLAALVLRGDHSLAVRLRDLSRGGACADALSAPAAGSAVRLRVEQLTIEANVAWARGARFGLAFRQPISATSLLVLLGHSRAQAKG